MLRQIFRPDDRPGFWLKSAISAQHFLRPPRLVTTIVLFTAHSLAASVSHAEDKFPDLPVTLNTGIVNFRLPTKMVAILNDRPNDCKRTIWITQRETKTVAQAGPKTNVLSVLLTRIKFTDKAWPSVSHDPANMRQEVIATLTNAGQEIQSEMLYSTPAEQKSLYALYTKVQDPRKIFGKTGIGHAVEWIDPKKPPGATVGSMTPAGTVYLSDSTGGYFSATAYIVDMPRKTHYLLQVASSGAKDLSYPAPTSLRIVMSADINKPKK